MNSLGYLYRKAMWRIDGLSDSLTSYRLVFYFLVILVTWSVFLAAFGRLPFLWYEILLSAAVLCVAARVANIFLARRYKVAPSTESDLITALILALILSPPATWYGWLVLPIVATVAMASKYFLLMGHKHIFNPAAAGAVFAGIIFGYWPSWWVGVPQILPLVMIGGLLIARKMKRLDMVALFIGLYLLLTFLQLILDIPPTEAFFTLIYVFSTSALVFFATIMLTEPLTSPTNRRMYLGYAALVAAAYSITGLGIRPEMALLLGNVAAATLAPNPRRQLKFRGSHEEAPGIMSFSFEGKQGLSFEPGQYMEWTLPQTHTDGRGNRRYMSLSSSPTESTLMFTSRMPEPKSSFKRGLLELKPEQIITAGQLSGDFVLPISEKRKLAFLAGGIGITPFRSMAVYINDFKQERDIQLLYFAEQRADFIFKSELKAAASNGLNTHYVITGKHVPENWSGLQGQLSGKLLSDNLPDYHERLFYVSGPHAFVTKAEEILLALGVRSKNIKVDYFPGYS